MEVVWCHLIAYLRLRRHCFERGDAMYVEALNLKTGSNRQGVAAAPVFENLGLGIYFGGSR